MPGVRRLRRRDMTDEAIFRVVTATLFVSALLISVYHRHKADRASEKVSWRDEGLPIILLLRLSGLAAWLLFSRICSTRAGYSGRVWTYQIGYDGSGQQSAWQPCRYSTGCLPASVRTSLRLSQREKTISLSPEAHMRGYDTRSTRQELCSSSRSTYLRRTGSSV